MNHTLKAAGRIGAELGAAKAENEKLRGLLERIATIAEEREHGYATRQHGGIVNGRCANKLVAMLPDIHATLSQQPDPPDTYTAVDMATAVAQGFRDGQAAVEQATEQDDQYPPCDYCGVIPDHHPWHGSGMFNGEDSPHIHACNDCRHLLPASPAQTEQQPVAWARQCDLTETREKFARLQPYRRPGYDVPLYAAPIAQPEQPEQSGLSLPRTRLERIERRLTDWLELNCCECESGHSCGRNEVTADRDAIRAALSAQGESHEQGIG